jgi:hypothetical protein
MMPRDKETPRAPTSVRLLNLLDIERGASLRAESKAVAVRLARELSEGMTQDERIAVHEFLNDVARTVRWPESMAPI